ncbi:MAG: hypothetical protein IH587_14770, partial [Anaerolineae bacterium]|nr:hypothetical protein [Anaerolineae bacterium]
VYYLLGEQFDQDPFLIFTLRGRTQAQIMEALRNRRAAAAEDAAADDSRLDASGSTPALDADLVHFWGQDALDWVAPHIAAPDRDAAVLRRLGAPPGNVSKPLEAVYRAMTARVQQIVFSSPDEQDV